jgi:hypothetical protein
LEWGDSPQGQALSLALFEVAAVPICSWICRNSDFGVGKDLLNSCESSNVESVGAASRVII